MHRRKHYPKTHAILCQQATPHPQRLICLVASIKDWLSKTCVTLSLHEYWLNRFFRSKGLECLTNCRWRNLGRMILGNRDQSGINLLCYLAKPTSLFSTCSNVPFFRRSSSISVSCKSRRKQIALHGRSTGGCYVGFVTTTSVLVYLYGVPRSSRQCGLNC